MKTFHCGNCGGLLFFENVQCLGCGLALGFLPELLTLSSLEPAGDGRFRALTPPAQNRLYKKCANDIQHQICNWLVPAEDRDEFCASCRLNLVIPNLGIEGNLKRWHDLERAKRRVLYTLFHLGLPTEGMGENRHPLRFKFLNDGADGKPVLTGHNGGEITINVAEADDEERERRRVGFREPYRTLVGHLRHEVAHYYWDLLIGSSARLAAFRGLFGDESADYGTSLKTYYEQGPPADWQTSFVSAYACAHPWEDWAETWAHYLHMVDTLEAAASFGMTLQFAGGAGQSVVTSNPLEVNAPETSFEKILENWLPLTTALNSVNRAMGLSDLYPFILPDAAVRKMHFVHDVIHSPTPMVAPAPPLPTPLGSPNLAGSPEARPVAIR